MSFEHSEFVHLHTHSEYSFLDGAIRIDDLVQKAAEQKAPATALTDHGGLFGALEFYKKSMNAGIKPILGFEAYVAPRGRKERSKDRYHLILLAESNKGWENIMKLSSVGYTEGFYYKPRIDYEVLREYSEGIIATSACIGGEIAQGILRGERETALNSIDTYLDIFGADNFFIELQDHGMDDEHIVMEQLIDMAGEKGVPLIVANDAHYLTKEDADPHDVLLCMQTNARYTEENRFRFPTEEFYVKDPEEMRELFPDIPEAMTNTVRIAERCSVDPFHKPKLPSTGIPESYSDEGAYLKDLAYTGAEQIYGELTPTIEERLDFELDIIISMGFPGYFLIVRDFLLWADKHGIMRGCRGSAAGSLVGRCIGITNVDPLKYDLIFERFLNPERISMPDVDADIADSERGRVIQYCVDKYGSEAVSQIINFGRMKAKNAVKDVARVMGIPPTDSQMLSNMVSESTISESIDKNGELKDLLQKNSLYDKVFAYAQKLEGLARQPGMHAGGVIIAPGDIPQWSPVYKQAAEGTMPMTQFDMGFVEDTGLIKMDILGLRTLSVIQETVNLIKDFHGVEIDIWNDIVDGDEKTYAEIFHTGETVEIFQFESPGMRKHLKKLRATSIEDLIAMTSLFRPGPMENIDSFIRRKHGKEKIEYPHPMLKSILDVTYGIIVYQEQVMRIAQQMGQFTLGQADILRKAMGKKKLDVMEEMKKDFLKGAENQKIDLKKAEAVWDLMAKFAKYGFNKAHACVYAHVSYQAAYLKAHYPCEYMAAVMTSRLGDQKKFVSATEEARRLGIEVLPPNINVSTPNCSVQNGKISIGLRAIANVGKASTAIVEEREKRGGYQDLFDLCCRVNLHDVSKKALESLVWAGAMDCFGEHRSTLCNTISIAVDYGKKQQEESASGQTNLFGESTAALPVPAVQHLDEWEHFDLLNKEKEVMNFYVSGHPLEHFKDEIRGFSTMDFSEETVARLRHKQSVLAGGVITGVKKFNSRKDGSPMAFMSFEDLVGEGELFFPPKMYELHSHLCNAEEMVLVRGTVEKEHVQEDSVDKIKCKIVANKVMPLDEARTAITKAVRIHITTSGLERTHLEEILETCKKHGGGCIVLIHLHTGDGNEYVIRTKNLLVSSSRTCCAALRKLAAVDDVVLSQRTK
ncbi:DNA polymerase III subunit alpha [Chitinivibrio alkaliphilus]|uniref:DNA polymerase III subunit alpha n=1 Tax=Chitinivibrio alkaliphilus ACht1 TaxID=1313304 RepID=U7DBC1_9BACT|nr:DNA polymerase III subunit alpha [Chitinivibrio alkaliphilus]ERP39307.1 DNA polymerase III, alpha subunit [Chitinivibrio alkaliphilus ACht1]